MGSETPASPSPGSSSIKWWICGLLLLATTLNYMDRSALYQTSVRICNDLNMSDKTYGDLEACFNVAYGTGALLFGFIVDKASLRWTYAFIVFAWSLVGFATGFVSTIFWLFVCRILLGLFEAANWPCGILTVKRVLPPPARSLGNGMFQSGTALGAILTPIIVLACIGLAESEVAARTQTRLAMQSASGGAGYLVTPLLGWQLTFRLIGAAGLVWVVVWLLIVRSRHVAPPPDVPDAPGSRDSYWVLFRDRRFWLLALTVVAVNVPWRSFVVWLPKYLQQVQGYTEVEMQKFMLLYYIAADVGSITVGFVTLRLVNKNFSLLTARLWTFLISALMATMSVVAVQLPPGPGLLCILLVIGFAVLGSFPTYFALSQEVSARHQGKVTGTLGGINAAMMAILVAFQGRLIQATGSYKLSLGLTGLTPILAVIAIYWFWPREKVAPAAS